MHLIEIIDNKTRKVIHKELVMNKTLLDPLKSKFISQLPFDTLKNKIIYTKSLPINVLLSFLIKKLCLFYKLNILKLILLKINECY